MAAYANRLASGGSLEMGCGMTGSDTRAQARRLMSGFQRKALRSITKVLACAAVAVAAVLVPASIGWYDDLPQAGRATIGILVFAALLWVTEAMPAFAVALWVVGLEIAILGHPGGVHAAEGDVEAWRTFVTPWSSPLIWLFLGGFVLAHCCAKTGLDRQMATSLLSRVGPRPGLLLGLVMAGTFVFSMFMSNTATAAMMMAVLAPLGAGAATDDRRLRGIFLAVAVAANLGGMGTIIGSPPNAIAAGQLSPELRPDFLRWMLIGLPPALVLVGVSYLWIRLRYFRGMAPEDVPTLEPVDVSADSPHARLNRWLVAGVFTVTVLMWMGESIHGIPSPVISFIPIIVLAVTGVMGHDDIRGLPWDILLLLFGGMSLGIAVQETGVAAWMAGLVPEGWSAVALVSAVGLMTVVLSNLMSSTATASILVPVGIGLVATSASAAMALAVALSCPLAMCLPISTPPNAVAFATGRVKTVDLLGIGLLLAVVGPVVVIPWVLWML
jgi:sodium-dependent dicarboxylate transporter 2/3/5